MQVYIVTISNEPPVAFSTKQLAIDSAMLSRSRLFPPIKLVDGEYAEPAAPDILADQYVRISEVTVQDVVIHI